MPFKLLSNTLSFFVMSTKEAFDMFTVGWAAFTDIDCYVEYAPFTQRTSLAWVNGGRWK